MNEKDNLGKTGRFWQLRIVFNNNYSKLENIFS